MRTTGIRTLSLTAVLATTALGACGGESNQLAAKDGYCDQVMALDRAVLESQEQPDNATPAQLAAHAREEARRYEPILERLVATAPSAVVGDARTLQSEMANMAMTGDDSFLDGPGYGKANGSIHRAAHDGCGYQKVTIAASDYAFGGIPRTLDAGRVSFLLNNTSKSQEPHVAVIARIKDGVNDTADQLAKEGEAAFAKLDLPPAGGAFAVAGQSGGLLTELSPGRYFVFCDIPTGGAPGAAPHTTHGMVAEFKVK